MRQKTLDMINKIKTLLIENEHIQAPELAEKCHLSRSSIYRLIRVMINEGIAIQTTNKGYILSEFAGKKDDTNFFRRINGRRASDFLSLQACAPFIKKRWRGIEDKKMLKQIFSSLDVDQKALQGGLDSIKFLEDKHGLDKV